MHVQVFVPFLPRTQMAELYVGMTIADIANCFQSDCTIYISIMFENLVPQDPDQKLVWSVFLFFTILVGYSDISWF